MEKILAEIEAVKELRAENERLRAALERGQARPGGGLAIELRGIVVGASSSAALIHVGTRQWLVRVGDHLPLGPAGPGAEDAVVLSIDGDQVELQLGPEGRLQLR